MGVNHCANLPYLRGNQNWKLVYKPMKREYSSHLPSLVISLLGVTPTIQIMLLSIAMLFFSLAKIHNRKHLSRPAPWAKITVNKCRLFSIFRIQHLWSSTFFLAARCRSFSHFRALRDVAALFSPVVSTKSLFLLKYNKLTEGFIMRRMVSPG